MVVVGKVDAEWDLKYDGKERLQWQNDFFYQSIVDI